MHSVFHLGPIALPVFGVLAAVGLVCALVLAEWNAVTAKIDRDAVWNVCVTAILGTLIISRAVLILESPRAFVGYPLMVLTLPTVTRFGLLAAIVCGLVYALYKRLPLLRLGDVLAPAAILLATFVHLGHFFAGEDIGVATTSMWGRIVPSLRGSGVSAGVGSYPVALYAAVASLLITVGGVVWLRRTHKGGEVLGGTLVLAAASQFVLDLVRFHGFDAQPRFGLYLSQWVLLVVVIAGGALLIEKKESAHAL